MQDQIKTTAMFDLVEQWQQSGKSQSQFSSDNGIKHHTFGYWVKKYRETHEAHEGFTSLQVSDGDHVKSHPTPARIEIEFDGSIVVRIY